MAFEFFLKKLAGALTQPFVLALLFAALMAAWVGRRQGWRVAVMILLPVGLLAALSTPWVALRLVEGLEAQYSPLSIQGGGEIPAWIVVLGASAREGLAGESAVSRLSPIALQRLSEGLRLSRAFPKACVLLSGGAPGAGAPVARLMYEAALELGADTVCLEVLDTPLDTAGEAREVFRRVGAQPVMLVTSASHMPRAVRLFEGVGVSVIPAPTGFSYQSVGSLPKDWLPQARYLALSERALWEYGGLLWAMMRN